MSISQRRHTAATSAETYLDLFKDCFPETNGTSLQTEEHYLWKYGTAGKSSGVYELGAWEEEKIVGYYAALPFSYQLDGKPYVGGMVCDVMTHSCTRGKGVFTAMGRTATAEMGNEGIAFCLGFPIRSYVFPGHIKVGWSIAFDLPVWFRLVDPTPALASRNLGPLGLLFKPINAALQLGFRLTRQTGTRAQCTSVSPNDFFGSGEYEKFYEEWARQYPNHLTRSSNFFRWRLSAPNSSYKVIAVHADGELAGLAVCRNAPLQGFQITSILELMILERHAATMNVLHDGILAFAKESGSAGIVIMSTTQDSSRLKLFRNAYFKSRVTFKLILKWLSNEPEPNTFWDPGAWHLTWIDTDNL